MRITVDYIMSLNPCNPPYTREHVEKLFGGRKYIYPKTIFRLDIPLEDKVWVFCYSDILTDREKYLFACACEGRISQIKRPLALIREEIDWLEGKIIGGELCNYWSAYWSALGAAYWETNKADLEREWQLNWIKECLEGRE